MAGVIGVSRNVLVGDLAAQDRHAVGTGGDHIHKAGAAAVGVVAALTLVGRGRAAPEEPFRKTMCHYAFSFFSNLMDSAQVTIAVTMAVMTSAMMMLMKQVMLFSPMYSSTAGRPEEPVA